MALLHGKLADIYWDSQGTDTELKHGQSWSLDATHEVEEITSMQDTWKSFMYGFQDWTATVTCLSDSGGDDIGIDETADPAGWVETGVRLELYLTFDTNDYKVLYGNCFCSGRSVANGVDGITTITYTFTSNGQLLWSTGAARP